MNEIVYKHSSGGLIFHDSQVLLINWQAPRSSFDFPKGTIEAGETPEQTCVREVLEETGYRTKIIAPIGQTQYEYDWLDGSHHKKKVDYFLLELEQGAMGQPAREAHETFENIWLSPDDAMHYLTRGHDRVILKKALTMLPPRSTQ